MILGGELVGFLYTDLGSITRARVVPRELAGARMESGVSWVPANQVITPLGELVQPNPFGSVGDLRLLADRRTHVRVDTGGDSGPLEIVLCSAATASGRPWPACPRVLLEQVEQAFEDETGLCIRAAFEHEFRVESPDREAGGFTLESVRTLGAAGPRLVRALSEAGCEPLALLAEFGPHQYEVPCAPAGALAAADRSVLLKEIVRDVIRSHGRRATFCPTLDGSPPTSGVHIHLSLIEPDGTNAMFAPGAPGDLAPVGAAFVAGLLEHAPALAVLTASSPISGLRLRPGLWSAGQVALAHADREALLRLPMATADDVEPDPGSFNVEYRAADATASPYLALAALLIAGLDGVRRRLPCPPLGLPARPEAVLPATLGEGLRALDADTVIRDALPDLLLEAFLTVKRGELAAVEDLDAREACARYAAVY